LEVYEVEKIVLSLSRNDNTYLPQGNKWYSANNMC